MKHCFIIPRIPTALFFYRLANPVFISFWTYVVKFWHSSISLFVIFLYIVRSILCIHLILKQLVSCGESRPGPPNPSFSFRPGILGPEYPEKGTLTIFYVVFGLCFREISGSYVLFFFFVGCNVEIFWAEMMVFSVLLKSISMYRNRF